MQDGQKHDPGITSKCKNTLYPAALHNDIYAVNIDSVLEVMKNRDVMRKLGSVS
jgi:hypothetical protein